MRIASDEPGAGSDGARTLLAIRPEVVKIDRLLIEGLDHDRARRALVGGLVTFADETGASLVAEGVETVEEYDDGAGARHPAGPGVLDRPARVRSPSNPAR